MNIKTFELTIQLCQKYSSVRNSTVPYTTVQQRRSTYSVTANTVKDIYKSSYLTGDTPFLIKSPFYYMKRYNKAYNQKLQLQIIMCPC